MPKCFGLFLLLLVLPSLAPCILGRLEHFFRHTHKENNTKPKATGNTLGKKFQLTMHKLNHSLEPTLPVCTGQPSSNLFQSWPFSTPCVVDVSDQPQINHPCPPQCVSCHRSAAARLGQRGPGNWSDVCFRVCWKRVWRRFGCFGCFSPKLLAVRPDLERSCKRMAASEKALAASARVS